VPLRVVSDDMVYGGKPSAGCGLCRSKRKKCDEARPECNNCIRAGRACPGYRNKLDMMFRHETANVVSKVRKAKRDRGEVTAARSSDRRKSSDTMQVGHPALLQDWSPGTSLGGSSACPIGVAGTPCIATSIENPGNGAKVESLPTPTDLRSQQDTELSKVAPDLDVEDRPSLCAHRDRIDEPRPGLISEVSSHRTEFLSHVRSGSAEWHGCRAAAGAAE